MTSSKSRPCRWIELQGPTNYIADHVSMSNDHLCTAFRATSRPPQVCPQGTLCSRHITHKRLCWQLPQHFRSRAGYQRDTFCQQGRLLQGDLAETLLDDLCSCFGFFCRRMKNHLVLHVLDLGRKPHCCQLGLLQPYLRQLLYAVARLPMSDENQVSCPNEWIACLSQLPCNNERSCNLRGNSCFVRQFLFPILKPLLIILSPNPTRRQVVDGPGRNCC